MVFKKLVIINLISVISGKYLLVDLSDEKSVGNEISNKGVFDILGR